MCENGRTHRVLFDSMDEQIAETRKVVHLITHGTGQDLHGLSDFIGREFKGWEDVDRATKEFWVDGMQAYEKMMYQLRDAKLPKPQSIKRTRRWSEEGGDEIDLDRLRRGEAFWNDSHRENRPTSNATITIMANTSTPAYQDSMNVLWRGAAAVALTELIEQAGYRAEVWAMNYVASALTSGKNLLSGVCLKRTGMPLNTSSLVNGFSGWNYRTITFADYWLVGVPSMGYGQCRTMTKETAKLVTPDDKVAIADDLFSFNRAVQWVRDRLAEFCKQEAK